MAAERRGIAKGHASGLAEGAQRNAIANARNLLKKSSLTAEMIVECCSLSLEQVLALKNELKIES